RRSVPEVVNHRGDPITRCGHDQTPIGILRMDTRAELPEQFGPYRILGRLGQGGMGMVYLANDTRLDRQVALKVPSSTPQDRQETWDRFEREARIAASLYHPNLCPVYEVGQIGGTHYLAMAYIEGQILASLVDGGRPMPEQQAIPLVRSLALALAYAHGRGVI